MQLGATLPVADIGTGPTVVRDYAQAAEGLGYSHLLVGDHVLGANPERDARRVRVVRGRDGEVQRWFSSRRHNSERVS